MLLANQVYDLVRVVSSQHIISKFEETLDLARALCLLFNQRLCYRSRSIDNHRSARLNPNLSKANDTSAAAGLYQDSLWMRISANVKIANALWRPDVMGVKNFVQLWIARHFVLLPE